MSARPLQRSPRQSGSSFVWIIGICCLLIIAGVRYVFFTDKDATTTPSSDSATTGASTYYIGEKIIAGGQMNPVSTFTTYTHDFVTEEGELFGLKSIEIDLYQYSGSVDIKGEVTDFKEELPIITVTEIVGSKQGTGVAGSVIDGNPDYYFFKDV